MATLIGRNVSFEEINRITQPGYFLNRVDPTTGRMEIPSAKSAHERTNR
jgi:hypothetical protein